MPDLYQGNEIHRYDLTDPDKLEKELIQASAVFAAWLYDLRRRRAAAAGGA